MNFYDYHEEFCSVTTFCIASFAIAYTNLMNECQKNINFTLRKWLSRWISFKTSTTSTRTSEAWQSIHFSSIVDDHILILIRICVRSQPLKKWPMFMIFYAPPCPIQCQRMKISHSCLQKRPFPTCSLCLTLNGAWGFKLTKIIDTTH